MKQKIYEKPLAEVVVLSTEDIMSLSINELNEARLEDSVNIKDLI